MSPRRWWFRSTMPWLLHCSVATRRTHSSSDSPVDVATSILHMPLAIARNLRKGSGKVSESREKAGQRQRKVNERQGGKCRKAVEGQGKAGSYPSSLSSGTRSACETSF